MSGMGSGSKFNRTTAGHTHPETPRVFYGEYPPAEGMRRGDIWVQTGPIPQENLAEARADAH